MLKPLYFLPARGARLNGRLGTELAARGYQVEGRTLHDGFESLDFQTQLSVIRNDLTAAHFEPSSIVVAHSYGAHLCLSSLMGLPPFPGTLALVSPAYRQVQVGFSTYRVPGALRLADAIDQNRFPTPLGRVGVVSGDDDWQVPVDGVVALKRALGAAVTLVNSPHELPAADVQQLLDSLAIKP